MKKQIYILVLIFLGVFGNNKVYSQSTDTLIYNLANHTVDQYYQEVKEILNTHSPFDTEWTFRDTTFQMFVNAKIPTYNHIIEPPDGAYIMYLQYILKNWNLNEFQVFRGIGEGVDTLRWGSMDRQIKYPPIDKWDCSKIDKKFICTDHFDKEKEKARTYIMPRPIDERKKNPMEKYRYDREKAELNPQKYGVQVGYPVLFEYNEVIYGFSVAQYQMFNISSNHNKKVYYYLSKWNGDVWEIIRSR